MAVITTSIVVKCPIEEVFAFVTDARNNPLWQSSSGLRATQQQPDGPVGVGTRITETWHFMGHTTENSSEVTVYEPNSRYVRTALDTSGPIETGEQCFEATADGTRWTSEVQIQARGLFAIAEPLLASTMKKGFETNMAEAKALLERRVAEIAR